MDGWVSNIFCKNEGGWEKGVKKYFEKVSADVPWIIRCGMVVSCHDPNDRSCHLDVRKLRISRIF